MSYHPTGATPDDLAPLVRALQAQVNRFGAALPVTGVLDAATGNAAFQLVTQALLRATTKDPGNASIKAQYLDAAKSVKSGPAWVAVHVPEAIYSIRELGDALGKPAASGDLPLPLPVLIAGGVAALLLLTRFR